jgi:2'-5' RNA ligase
VAGDRVCLDALAHSVDEALAAVGFTHEVRAFNPHLTLARVPDDLPPADAARIGPLVQALGLPAAGALAMERFSLIRSVLQRGGARYSNLSSWTLGGRSEG